MVSRGRFGSRLVERAIDIEGGDRFKPLKRIDDVEVAKVSIEDRGMFHRLLAEKLT